MLAFITNLSFGEVIAILVVAVLIFGRRLPEVAARGAVHRQRLRRGMQEFRRESGFDEEIRKARRIIENPIKSAVDEVTKEPAAWRPPSPRVAPHPTALVRDEEQQDEVLDVEGGEVAAEPEPGASSEPDSGPRSS
jgi:Sec-independent protein translocase protein TatA